MGQEKEIRDADLKDTRNRELCIRIQNGDRQASEELIKENEGLIYFHARSLTGPGEADLLGFWGIELDDLLQVGRLAIYEASMSYDLTSDIRFSTYAFTIVRNAIFDLCRKASTVFECQVLDDGNELVYLDDNPVDEDGIPICDKHSDSRESDPVGEEAVHRITILKMLKRLAQLSLREQTLLIYRYGLKNGEYKTIPEAAAYFHLSERHLRKIEAGALKKLRKWMYDGKIV